MKSKRKQEYRFINRLWKFLRKYLSDNPLLPSTHPNNEPEFLTFFVIISYIPPTCEVSPRLMRLDFKP